MPKDELVPPDEFRCVNCKEVFPVKHDECPKCKCRTLTLTDKFYKGRFIHGAGPITEDEKLNGAVIIDNIRGTALLKCMFCGVPCAVACSVTSENDGSKSMYPLFIIFTERLAPYLKGPDGRELISNEELQRDLRSGMSSGGTDSTGTTTSNS